MTIPPAVAVLSPAKLRRAVHLKRLIALRESQDACEASLAEYLRQAWPAFDSSPYTSNWHIGAIAEHLEAVTSGQIRRLLVNQPPRTGKTNLIAIAWPTWTWALAPEETAPLRGAGVRFLCASYGANKAEADGVTARRLIGSAWYQERWSDRVQIARDRDNQGQYDTMQGGYRISTGIPESLGKGGAIRIVDDPTKPDEVESDLQRSATLRAYDEVWRTRSNDPVYGAEVVVMQRLHENDLSGHILEERGGAGVVHLMLPMEYDRARHCHTVIGFEDPRQRDGELLWPQRFGPGWIAQNKLLMGPHSFAGQMNQIPTTRGGGIIPREHWKVWPPEGEEESWTQLVQQGGKQIARVIYPDLDYVLLSIDTAYTEDVANDWSACTAWGSFTRAGMPKIILLEAWRERMEISALVAKILDTAKRRKADGVLIEAKASGLSVMQEMRRLMRSEGDFTIFADVPKGDKVARLHAVSAAFSAGLVYAPERKWADMVIDEVAQFPRSRFKDLTDTVSAGVRKLREMGVVQHAPEVEEDRDALLRFDGYKPSVREQYGV